MRATLIISLVIAVLAVVFALQNPQMMEVNLLFVETEGSTALVLLITFIMGVTVGLLSTMPGRVRDRRELKQLRKKLQQQTPPAAGSTKDAASTTRERSAQAESSSS
jgi:putative membrane protein